MIFNGVQCFTGLYCIRYEQKHSGYLFSKSDEYLLKRQNKKNVKVTLVCVCFCNTPLCHKRESKWTIWHLADLSVQSNIWTLETITPWSEQDQKDFCLTGIVNKSYRFFMLFYSRYVNSQSISVILLIYTPVFQKQKKKTCDMTENKSIILMCNVWSLLQLGLVDTLIVLNVRRGFKIIGNVLARFFLCLL